MSFSPTSYGNTRGEMTRTETGSDAVHERHESTAACCPGLSTLQRRWLGRHDTIAA